jgi:hypothetical protein
VVEYEATHDFGSKLMPGFPLNLGTILGGVTQGWNQSQDQALRQAIQRMAMQQQQQQRQAQTLAGLGLSAGLLNTQPMSPITNSPQLPPSQPAPQPPMPGQPSVPAPSATSWPAPSPSAPPPPVDSDSGFSIVPGTQTFAPPPTGGDAQMPGSRGNAAAVPPPQPGAATGQQVASSEPISVETLPPPGAKGSPAQTPAAPAKAPATASAPPAADNQGGSTGSQGGGSDVVASLPSGQSLPIPDIFRTLDPGHIAQRLTDLAPPGTDPATIYAATADLLKLSDGNKTEQIQAAYLGKLLGIQMQVQGRHEDTQTRAATQQTIATGNQQTRTNIANLNSQTRLQIAQANSDARQSLEQFKQDRIDARNGARLAQTASRIQAQAVAARDQNLSRQAGTIRAQIAAVKPGADGTYSDGQQAALKGYADQLGQINQQLAANYGTAAAPAQ